jgi:8-oxo-dGTP diphosphatase
VVGVAYLAIAPDLPIPDAGSDARSARWAPVEQVRSTLAFDHSKILDDTVGHVRSRLEFITLATAFWGQAFTIGDAQRV